jgi:putative radical SAM enzyme (TIGR03279 family)
MKVTRVTPGSEAERAGIRAGDKLSTVNGRRVEDSIDLTFTLAWSDDSEAVIELSRGGASIRAVVPAENPGELGLEVEEAPTRTCGNSCVFCFVDQLPRGLRTSLYVKDEDYRLSFSYGNYVTLTNISDADFERIAEQRLSPLYVSVHATDDSVRRAMLGNDGAPPILESLRRLGDAGIRVHAQAVLCPGMNDGEVLERTLRDLFELGEMIESIAIVPVGLTGHRQGLPEIESLSAEAAGRTLDSVARWQKLFLSDRRSRTVYAADELYLSAGRTLPPCEEYEELPQLENGVGLLRMFGFELKERAGLLGGRLERPLRVTLVTGVLAGEFLKAAIGDALGGVDGLTVQVVASPNGLLGPTVTVAGLLSGADMVDALKSAPESDAFLLPGAAFNEDGVSLDGMTPPEIAAAAGRKNVTATDDLVGSILNLAGREPLTDGATGAVPRNGTAREGER